MAADTAHPPAAADAAGGLDVRLDAPLPAAVKVGRGTALFVHGTCFAPGEPIASLALLVDGEEQPVMAHGMPRLDLLHAAGEATSYRAGFWGMARVGERPPGGEVAVGVRARLRGGGERDAELGRVRVEAPCEPVAGAPLVAVCMATFEPPLELFRRQVASLRAQTLTDWVCVVSDDCSDPARFAAMCEVLEGDERFVVSRSDRRRGFYHNFERALELAPAGARYVALADQDDDWDPDKLETLVREIGDARLVYSDQRILSADGELLSGTYWSRRANNHRDMLPLLVANCVTGAASLFPRALLDDALPLPPAQFTHYHDHWLAVTALALGDIRYVDRALYGYVQHQGATIGHATATRMPRLRDRLSSLRRGPRERVRMWRMHYFVDACRVLHFAAVLELRCGDRMRPRKRRALERLARADRSLRPVPGLFARGARELARRRPQTLGAEWVLAYAFAWRRLLAASARDRPQRATRLDALPPLVLTPRPRARVPGDPDLRAIAERIMPLPFAVRDDAPPRVNLLVPDLEAGAPLPLARRLAERGLRVRIVTVDPVGPRPRSWAREVGLEVEPGRESAAIEISRDDAFVATTWWTAHVAHAALAAVEAERFLYLVEEHAPLAMPPGALAALAAQSYGFPHRALFASELLRGYFRARGLGVYREGAAAGDRASAAYEDAVPAAGPRAPRPGPRRLLFHAGPEPGAMFELGVLGLSRALELGAFAHGWTLQAAGARRAGRRLDLGGGDWMRLLPGTARADDPALLREHDLGLALAPAPHPGRVPLAMARAGMVVVTTTFETKTAEALAALSPDLVGAEPTVDGLAHALLRAEQRAAAGDRPPLRWSADWDASFHDALLDRVVALLAP